MKPETLPKFKIGDVVYIIGAGNYMYSKPYRTATTYVEWYDNCYCYNVVSFMKLCREEHMFASEQEAWKEIDNSDLSSRLNLDFATADPDEIQLACELGLAAEYTLGATRNITLTNGDVVTLRIADNTGSCVKKSDGNYGGLVIEFKDCYKTKYQMNSSNTNAGGWDTTQMRTARMTEIYNLLPSEWQYAISTAQIQTMSGGIQSGVSLITSLDKLWLPAEREIFATRYYSAVAEWDALKRFAWYSANDTDANRVKRIRTSAQWWWLRSTIASVSCSFVVVSADGAVSGSGAGSSYGVSPCFLI